MLIENNHDYNNLARSLLVLSSIYRKKTGLSKDYIRSISEAAIGYEKSDAMPAALYLLGDLYFQKRMNDESYSAFSDLVEKFPGSPEAEEAATRIPALKKSNPRRVAYLPDKKFINGTDVIDISPESNMPDEGGPAAFYSIMIGPLSSVKKVKELQNLLKGFESIRMVRLKDGYSLYVGRNSDEESALRSRVRLAEEYGINGRIVRISGEGDRAYIYGE